MADSTQDLKDRVRAFWELLFNQGDYAIIENTITPAYTYNGKPQSAEDLLSWVKSLRTQYPDMHFDIDDLLGDGDQVAIRWTMVGTDSSTKIKMTNSGTNIITFAGGHAVSNWQNGGQDSDFHPVG